MSWLSELLVLFIGLLYLIFLLISFPDIRANWRNYIPKKYLPQVETIVHELSVNMNAYFRGQALVALCVGILFAIGFVITGMPMGFVMGLIIGLLNLVPYMQALGIPPCILLCLVQSAQTGQPVWLTIHCCAEYSGFASHPEDYGQGNRSGTCSDPVESQYLGGIDGCSRYDHCTTAHLGRYIVLQTLRATRTLCIGENGKKE